MAGSIDRDLQAFMAEWLDGGDSVAVFTSGSTGKPKEMRATKERMRASARMTCEFLGLQEGDTALLCMPLKYIAGKMVVVRALEWGLHLVVVEPCGHPLVGLDKAPVFAAMVPIQVYNSLQVEEERELLRGIRHLIIGGGPVDDAMADALRDFPNNVWSTYGMTETLSHVAMRRVNGEAASLWYTPMRGVDVSLTTDGRLVISAPHVCSDVLVTNDVAELRSDGAFRILGRMDNVVDTGGVKVQVEEVERLLRPYMQHDYAVTWVSDAKFGQALCLMVESDDATVALSAAAIEALPRYWRPRHIFAVSQLPKTETAKLCRSAAHDLAEMLFTSRTPDPGTDRRTCSGEW